MPRASTDLRHVIALLQKHYGPPRVPKRADPLEMILWENIAYLVDDTRRAAAFAALRSRVGTKPQQLLDASDGDLLAVARLGGMRPEDRVEKLRRIGALALALPDGDLRQVLRLPVAEARKALCRFPGIGAPGADKILLFCRREPRLALESNGLRALLRLGFGAEKGSYASRYRSVQEAIAAQLDGDFDWLIGAHLALRQHGSELCRRNEPMCEICPLADSCAHALAFRPARKRRR